MCSSKTTKDEDIKDTYHNYYLPLYHMVYGEDPSFSSRDNLSNSIQSAAEQIIICIENNIKIHFMKRLSKFIHLLI